VLVNKGRPLIVIIDDEESVRRALTRLMLSAGYQSLSFASGSEFFESLGTNQPDCVILDVHMPGMSGFDIQSRLRDEKSLMLVVIITGNDTPESQERGMRRGAAAYLRKPVDDQVLLDAIAAAIASKTKERR
jgi:FixJ family two-component response regulator